MTWGWRDIAGHKKDYCGTSHGNCPCAYVRERSSSDVCLPFFLEHKKENREEDRVASTRSDSARDETGSCWQRVKPRNTPQRPSLTFTHPAVSLDGPRSHSLHSPSLTQLLTWIVLAQTPSIHPSRSSSGHVSCSHSLHSPFAKQQSA